MTDDTKWTKRWIAKNETCGTCKLDTLLICGECHECVDCCKCAECSKCGKITGILAGDTRCAECWDLDTQNDRGF